jgi:hypothetical protein
VLDIIMCWMTMIGESDETIIIILVHVIETKKKKQAIIIIIFEKYILYIYKCVYHYIYNTRESECRGLNYQLTLLYI